MGIAQVGIGIPQVAQAGSFAAAVADLPGDGQGLIVILDGLAWVTQDGLGKAQAVQVVPFAAAVTDLPGDGQGLLVVLDGLAGVAQSVVGIPLVAQGNVAAHRILDVLLAAGLGFDQNQQSLSG